MRTTRQEETEEAALCRELYGLHFSSGNDSTRVYQHLMESLWGARTRIQEQESRIQRLTRTLQDIQKFMEHEPSEPPMSLKAGIILGWIEAGLGEGSSPSRRHSFSSVTTQTRDTHNTVECTTTRGCGDKESIIKTTRRKLVAMRNQHWRDRFEDEEEGSNESLRTPMQPDAGPRNPWRLIDARSNLRPCIFCGARHLHWRCPLEPEARMRTILERGKCTQCLKFGHASKSCQEEGCRKCGGRHHTWIHNENGKRETLRICQGQQRNSYQAPSTSSNAWTEVHQVFLVPTLTNTASPNNPRQGTSPGATQPWIESIHEAWRPADSTQSWRLNSYNRRQTKNQQPNAQE